jgi:DNA-binding SARP family transcriptional activator/tetratricopeptide (TPR) repeat protein
MGDMAAQPHFRLLGPVRVVAASGEEVELTPGRQSIVLAALLLNANRVVSSDHLIDLVWSEDPPATSRTQIQICVSELRKKFVRVGYAGVLRTRGPGYVVVVPDDELDHRLFEALVSRSRRLEQDGARLPEAADSLRAALALWRGQALEGVAQESLRSSVVGLEEGRAGASESLMDLRLRLGEDATVVAELRRMIERFPLRERPCGQLMTALYRTGRQADALEVYRDARRRLVDQLGVEPGSELRKVHVEILAGTAPTEFAVHPSHEPDRHSGEAAEHPAPLVRPFQLPADIADFGGHDELCSEIAVALAGTGDGAAMPVVVLTGKPGVGKSAVAVHVAHGLRTQFPDGQLYSELSGSGPEPAPVGEVLARFIRALGAPGSAIPDGEVERADLFRTLMSGRRMLVLLDDAASDRQVRALLPGTPSCAVVVTGRTMLTGLAGAVVHQLDVLDATRSRELLARMIGAERVNADSVTADALVRIVGGLPLALRIVGARLAARPRWPLSLMLDRLSDERYRLDELTHGEMMMRASLAMSYDGLPPEAARLLRLLCLVEMSSYPAWVAAALLDSDEDAATQLLELLVDVHLLEVAALDLDGTPRYRFHVIVRMFAHERLHAAETADTQCATMLRVGGAWLAMIDEAHRRGYGGDYVVVRSTAARRAPDERHTARLLLDPLAWLESERGNACSFIAATARSGTVDVCWDLSVSMVDLFESGSYFEDWATTHDLALTATRQSGNRRGEAAVLASLGTLHLIRGRPDHAQEVLGRALEHFVALDDTMGTALAHRDLAWVARLRGDDDAAVGGYRAAFTAFEAVDDPIGRAHVLGRLAEIELAAGRPDAALAELHRALALCRTVGNPRVEIQTLFRISTVTLQQGRLGEAESALHGLLDRVRGLRDVIGEAKILQQLGTVRLRQGDPSAALRLLEQAVDVRERTLDHAGMRDLRAELGRARTAASC